MIFFLAKCGFTATATDNAMTLLTPFHPSLYSDNVFCEWTLRAAVDKLIEITFVEGETEDCCDFVQVYRKLLLFLLVCEKQITYRNCFSDIANTKQIFVAERSCGT